VYFVHGEGKTTYPLIKRNPSVSNRQF